MDMVKEIMGQSLVEAFSAASLHPKRHFQKQNQFALSQTMSSSVKTTLELRTVRQLPAPLIPFREESKRSLVLNPVTVTVAGTVTIKNSKDRVKEMMAMMLQYFDGSDMNVRRTGLVMLLVSTKVDPSKY